MPRQSRSAELHDEDVREPDDRGSAALEFIFVGLLMLVPLVYLIVALGQIQGQALAVESGARHIARAVATASDVDEARLRADRIAASVTREYGMDAGTVTVSMSCTPAGATCPEAGAVLKVRVATRVKLPLAPPVLGLDRLAGIPVEATAVQKMSTRRVGR
jgi:Flp pilus assembly protein TadG